MLPSGWVAITAFALDLTLRIALALVIIIRRRPVSTSLAWLSLVLFVPFLGLFAYLLVGENRLGVRRRRRFDQIALEMEARAISVWRHRYQIVDERTQRYAHIAHYGLGVCGMPPLAGNVLDLIHDTEDFLSRVAGEIDGAKHHVHLLTYIWQVTPRTQLLVDALADAAERGVECRVLVDGVGSRGFLKSAQRVKLEAAGVHVVEALPVSPLRLVFARLDLRNHRKIIVVDGHTAFCGSQNIADSSFRSSRWRDTGPWIDASLRIRGPAAQLLGLVFLADWQLDSGETIEDFKSYLPPIDAPPEGSHESVIQIMPSGPGPTPDAIHQALLTMIYSAREELIMTTPYFVPDDATRTALQAAAIRGVAVTIVMPRTNDSMLVAAASKSHYLDLLEAGVRIMHYKGGLLHSKTITVDRDVGLITSANFDGRSFWLNFEISAFIFDGEFASVVRFMQTGYIEQSERVTLAAWRDRPWRNTLWENTVQLMGPLL